MFPNQLKQPVVYNNCNFLKKIDAYSHQNKHKETYSQQNKHKETYSQQNKHKGMLLCLKHAAEITMILYVCNMKCYGIFVVIGND
jgi:hypothetical protein